MIIPALAILAITSVVMLIPYADAQADISVVPAREGECRIVGKCFSPSEVTIPPGETVTWKNAGDSSQTTVTSGEITEGPDGRFDSGLMASGVAFSYTFEDEGVYPYFSKVQPWMSGVITVEASTLEVQDEPAESCLIATAAYGSELAPQVQLLREVRDGVLLSTEAGSTFMDAFNSVYYAFSPVVADYERQNAAFAGAVRTVITPMIYSLSLMSLADEGSESQVLGLGVTVIALNLGLYVAAPAAGIFAVRRRL